jgi:hypothetical protein
VRQHVGVGGARRSLGQQPFDGVGFVAAVGGGDGGAQRRLLALVSACRASKGTKVMAGVAAMFMEALSKSKEWRAHGQKRAQPAWAGERKNADTMMIRL